MPGKASGQRAKNSDQGRRENIKSSKNEKRADRTVKYLANRKRELRDRGAHWNAGLRWKSTIKIKKRGKGARVKARELPEEEKEAKNNLWGSPKSCRP